MVVLQNLKILFKPFHRVLSKWVKFSGLVVILAISSFANSTEAKAKNHPEKTIYMVLWNGATVTDRGFLEYFKYKGYKIKVVTKNLNQKKELVEPLVKEIKAAKPDLVYIYGSYPCIHMLGTLDKVSDDKHLTKIPTIAYVIQPVTVNLLKPLEATNGSQSSQPGFAPSERNFTGISIAVDPKAQLNAIQKYSKGIKKITAVYTKLEPNAVASIKLFEEQALKMGFVFEHVNFGIKNNETDASSINDTIRKAAETKPDLVYLPPDGFILKNITQIGEELSKNKLPSFTGMEFGIEKAKTALIGVVASSYAAGQAGAVLADKILYQGKDPGKLPFEYVQEISFLVRSDTLIDVPVYPSIEVVEIAKFVDGPLYEEQKK
jgi:putative ABC transport system substrate-binding protein